MADKSLITSKTDSICKNCRLYKNRYVPSRGNAQSELALIGEAPGYHEDKVGKAFVGDAGKVLARLLVNAGIEEAVPVDELSSLDYDNIFLTNLARCRPPKNVLNLSDEAEHCSAYLYEELGTIVKPSVLVTLGLKPLKFLMRDYTGVDSIKLKDFRGVVFRNYPLNNGTTCSVVCTYHPSYLLRNQGNTHLFRLVEQDLHLAHKLSRGLKPSVRKVDLSKNPDLSLIYTLLEKPETKKQKTKRRKQESKSLEYIYCTTEEKIAESMSELRSTKTLALDIETTNRGIVGNRVMCVGLSPKHGKCYVWVCLGQNEKPFVSPQKVKLYLKDLFDDPDKVWIAHNSAFDFGVLGINWKIFPRGRVEDTMLMQHLLDENSPKDAKTLIDRHTSLGIYDETVKHTARYRGWTKIPDLDMWEYNSKDADGERRIYFTLKKLMKEDDVYNCYKNIVRPINKTLIQSSIVGLKVDREQIDLVGREYFSKLIKLDKKINQVMYEETGIHETFSTRANNDVVKMVFKRLQLDPIKWTRKKNEPSADKKSLEALQDQHRVIPLILEFKETQNLYSQYIKSIRKFMDSNDYIHPTFKPGAALTGRITSSDPSVSKIPQGASIKKLIVARPGYMFVYGDYSTAEYIILAAFSGDTKLRDDLKRLNIHDIACEVVKGEEFTKLYEKYKKNPSKYKDQYSRMRTDVGKKWNFAISYGGGDEFVSRQMNMPVETVRNYKEKYFTTYPGMREYIEKTPILAQQQGFLQSPYGRKRHFAGLKWDKHAYNVSLNYLPQTCCQDNTTVSAMAVSDEYSNHNIEHRIANMVYDSLMFEVEESRVLQAVDIMSDVCNAPIPELDDFEIPVAVGYGKSWYEAEQNSEENK